MDKIICENCEHENRYGAKFCKKCGHQLYYQEYIDEKSENNIKIQEDNCGTDTIWINLSVEEAEELIENSYLGRFFEIKDKRNINFSEDKKCIVVIAERYFFMVNTMNVATIIIDNAEKHTRVQISISKVVMDGLRGYVFETENKFYKQIVEIFKDYVIG